MLGHLIEWRSSFREYEGVAVSEVDGSKAFQVWEFIDEQVYTLSLAQYFVKKKLDVKELAKAYRRMLICATEEREVNADIHKQVIDKLKPLLSNKPIMLDVQRAIAREKEFLLVLEPDEEGSESSSSDKNTPPKPQLIQPTSEEALSKMHLLFLQASNKISKTKFSYGTQQSSAAEDEKSEEEYEEDYEDEEEDENDHEDENDEDEEEDDTEEDDDDDEDDEDDEESSESDDDEDKKIDIKVYFTLSVTDDVRGFTIYLTDDGLAKIDKQLKKDYSQILRLFYRDEEGDAITVRSGTDLVYAYRCAKKQLQRGSTVKQIKIKLFAEPFTPLPSQDLITSPPASASASAAAAAATPSLIRPNKQLRFTDESIPASKGGDGGLDVVEQQQQDIIWTRGELLGVGSFGRVFSCINIATAEKMAVKEVTTTTGRRAREQIMALRQEVAVLSSLRHANVIRYIGTEHADGTLRIFLELATDGSLKDALKEFGCLPEPLVRRYTADIVAGLRYLHDKKLIHRDIKPANLLLWHGIVKLADFGCCSSAALRRANASNPHDATESEHMTVAGTTIYMSPEVMQAGDDVSAATVDDDDAGGDKVAEEEEEDDEAGKSVVSEGPPSRTKQRRRRSVKASSSSIKKYGRKADVWSLGMTLCELATGNPPYKTAAAAIYAVCVERRLPSFPEHFSFEAHSFLARCLSLDPKERADSTEISSHIFLLPQSMDVVRAQTASALGPSAHVNSSVKLSLPDGFKFSDLDSSNNDCFVNGQGGQADSKLGDDRNRSGMKSFGDEDQFWSCREQQRQQQVCEEDRDNYSSFGDSALFASAKPLGRSLDGSKR